MKERPILFTGNMVRAILEGRKTMSRRVLKELHPSWNFKELDEDGYFRFVRCHKIQHYEIKCPYGISGDRLWVRETFGICNTVSPAVCYLADNKQLPSPFYKRKPSIFMPRWVSRILLEITNVRVERLQEISNKDAVKEGCDNWLCSKEEEFHALWDSINGKKYPWAANPWVWVIEFKRLKP
jgi:hypothetical protein